MSSIQEILNAITYLQVKIPEDLYKVKQDLEKVSLYENDANELHLLLNYKFQELYF